MTDYPTAPEGTSAQAFFDSMEALGFEYAGATAEGGRFRCPHPGHEDERPSCDVTIGRNGRPLLNCKVCEQVYDDHDEWFRDVKRAGVRFAGLPCEPGDVDWGERAAVTGGSHRVKGDGSERVNVKTITYDYSHEDGTPNFRAYRVQWQEREDDGSMSRHKTFFVRHYIRGSGFVSGLGDAERTPWKWERFADWAALDGGVLWLVEGEKAARALHKIKQPATTFQGGSGSPLTEGWVTRYGFDRFNEVRVWPDADEAGVERARRLLADLRAAGVKARAYGLVDVAPKDDAFDVIRAGRFEEVHPLSQADAKALAALNPLPSKPEKARQERPEPASLTLSDGTVLVSAAGLGGRESDAEPVEEDEDGEAPYRTSVNVEPYRFAEEFIDREFRNDDGVLTLRFRHDDRTFWLWSNRRTRYVHLTDDDVKAIVARRVAGAEETTPDGEVRPIKVKTKTWTDIIESLRLLTLTSEHGAGALLPVEGGIPFLNGWLNAETGELLPIGPERDVRWNVPEDYDPKARCPEWIKFLASCGFGKDTDEYRLLRQWFGYLLSGSKSHEKALLLIGESRAGKGVTIRVAERLLGGDQGGAAATSLDSLMSNFGLQAFIGKGLATVPDARFGRSDKGLNARLLSLTSNDTLPVDVKYGKPLSVNLGVRVMIGTNETPNFIEASDALARRFLVLRYGISHADNPDPGLFARLCKEIPGIARWALDGLRDLTEERRFVETKAGAEVQEQMILNGSYIRLFVEECCEFSAGAFTTNEDLGKVFNAWAEDNHVHSQSSTRIAMMLSDAFPARVGNDRRKVKGSVKRGKTGIQIRREYRFYAG